MGICVCAGPIGFRIKLGYIQRNTWGNWNFIAITDGDGDCDDELMMLIM